MFASSGLIAARNGSNRDSRPPVSRTVRAFCSSGPCTVVIFAGGGRTHVTQQQSRSHWQSVRRAGSTSISCFIAAFHATTGSGRCTWYFHTSHHNLLHALANRVHSPTQAGRLLISGYRADVDIVFRCHWGIHVRLRIWYGEG